MKCILPIVLLFFVGSAAFSQPVFPVDFESVAITFNDFDGGAATQIDNPQKVGINVSNKVMQMVKNAGQVWAGSWFAMASDINFTTNKYFKVKVFSPRVGARMLLKVENASNGGINFEREKTTTKAGEWEELTFDYTAINTANQYRNIVIIFDNGTAGDGSANFTFLIDDISLTATGGSGLAQMDLPVNFENAAVEYGLIGFGGAEASTIVADPNDPANKVAKVIKSSGAQVWAGTTVTGEAQKGFLNKVPFTILNTKMSVKVWSPHANIPVRLKVEDFSNGGISVETEATVTTANTWQTLVFNFASVVAGAPLNLANSYNKASLFFNFGTEGAVAGERIYYFDDLVFGDATLPVTFLDFQVVASGAQVNVQWSTASESNNKGFYVERSANGSNWSPLQFIKGGGNSASTRQYSFVDAAPNNGVNYYRIQQVDADGKASFSSIKAIRFGANTKSAAVFPNPAKALVNVALNEFTGTALITIKSVEGKVVASAKAFQANQIVTMDVHHLPAGTYVLQVNANNVQSVSKLIIQ